MKSLLICFFLVFLIACGGGGKNRPPKNVLSKEKMGQVLWDVIRADHFFLDFVSRDTSKKNERFKLYEEVYKVNHTTKEIFQKSYEYYSTHPDQLKVILDSIAARATRDAPTIQYGTGTNQKDSIAPK